jgi:hypothetical protein
MVAKAHRTCRFTPDLFTLRQSRTVRKISLQRQYRARSARYGAIQFNAIETIESMHDPVLGQHQAPSGLLR